MPTLTRKPSRTLRIVREGAGIKVIVTEGRSVKAYAVDPSRDGFVWWNAADSRLYDVWVSRGRAVSCSCKGWQYGGRCRHVSASNKLIDLGVIDPDGPPEGVGYSSEVE